MQFSKWLAILAALAVVGACFFPWVIVEERQVSIGGFHATINDYGKPGLLHAFFCGICVLFLLINRVWSIRTSFFISAINIAWALRNFFLISACRGGICPAKQPALYLLLIFSVLLTVLIPFVRVPGGRE